MNNRKLFALSYFLGRTFFLGFGFSYLMHFVGTDAWISSILGIGIGSLFLWLFLKLKERNPKEDNKLTQIIPTILFLVFNIFIYSQVLFIFQTFASAFFLIKSPIYFIALPIPFIIYRICKNGITSIAKVAEILVPISILLFFLGVLGLIPSFQLDSFTPVFNTSISNIIIGSLYFATFSTTPYFLLYDYKTNQKSFFLSYLFSCLTVLVVCIMIIAALGPNLIEIYRFPEYMVLKKIKLFHFIEKVENIISITWLFDLFTVLAIAGNNIKNCLPKKKKSFWFILLLIILHILMIAISINYQEELMLYQILPIVLGIIEIILGMIFYLFPKKST